MAALSAWRRVGRRNLAHPGFAPLLLAPGTAPEAAGPGGSDSGGGIVAAGLLRLLGSAACMLADAVPALAAPALPPLVALRVSGAIVPAD